MVDYTERNGKVLERVAFSVMHICRSLLPGIASVPYLRPHQLDSCMECTRSTAVLDMYCYTRMSRPCSHQEAAGGVLRLLGFAIAPSAGAGGEGADGEGADGEGADIEFKRQPRSRQCLKEKTMGRLFSKMRMTLLAVPIRIRKISSALKTTVYRIGLLLA